VFNGVAVLSIQFLYDNTMVCQVINVYLRKNGKLPPYEVGLEYRIFKSGKMAGRANQPLPTLSD
jgi:hypothetical protein